MDRGWGPANSGGVYAGQGYSEEMGGAAGRAFCLVPPQKVAEITPFGTTVCNL